MPSHYLLTNCLLSECDHVVLLYVVHRTSYLSYIVRHMVAPSYGGPDSNLSKSVVLTIIAYNTGGQPYRYKSCFLVRLNDAPAPFVLGLPFLIHANPNHEYDTGKFLWRKGKHTKANRMFTPSERKALKGVVNMSNLLITDHFIGLADLVTNMENYAVHMNSLCYDKKDDNVYNALPPEYHDFADIFQVAEKQSLPERGLHDHAIDLEPGQQPPFGKL